MSDTVPSFLLRRWPRFGATMALFTVLGLIDAGQWYVHKNYFRGTPIHWEQALAVGLGDWYIWAALAPFIFSLGWRFPLDREHWPRRLLLHLVLACGFMLIKVFFDLVLYICVMGKDAMVVPLPAEERMLPDMGYLVPLYKLYVIVKFYIYLILYGTIVGASHLVAYSLKIRERELLTSRLETQLAQTQLQVLRMQLQPHFLFNTLNAIAALMHKDLRLADRMLARLGELLRATLENPAAQEATLRQELAFLRPYLEIEQARLGSRLTVCTDVPVELLDAKLPFLLMQPLVENAIRHGIAPRVGPGRLAIRARRDNGQLAVEIADDGLGMPANGCTREGIGISNTRARLRGLYGDHQSLDLGRGPEGGVVATVTLPFREAESVNGVAE